MRKSEEPVHPSTRNGFLKHQEVTLKVNPLYHDGDLHVKKYRRFQWLLSKRMTKKNVKKEVIDAINKMDRDSLIRFIQFLDMLEGKQPSDRRQA